MSVEKNRTSTTPESTPVTKQVAGAPTSVATCCIRSALNPVAVPTTPATLPPPGTSEKAS